MMSRFLSKFGFALFLLLAVIIGAVAPAYAGDDDAALAKKVDEIFAQWDKPDSPGCALGIIKDGQFIYKRGYGIANLDYSVPISPTTSFYIASTSKQFTAMSIALLASQGKISLDDDIRKYVPEIPQYQSPITIRHLVHHTSGLRDYLELTSLAGGYFEDVKTDGDFIEFIARQKNLNFKPGEKYLYSNSGYFLLSQIVKRASGKSLRAFADENIFKPLGMANTRFHDDRTEIIKNRAAGYVPRKGGGFSVVITNFDGVGDGGLFTTIDDLLLWDQNFYNNKLAGGADLIESLYKPGTLNNGEKTDYAFALIPGDFKGLKMISHGGSFNGFRAEMVRFPAQKFSVACICNLGSINATGLATRVADIFLEKQLKQPAKIDGKGAASESTFLKLSERELADASGLYFNPITETYRRVTKKEGKLFVRSANNTSELKALSATRFLVANTPSRIEVSFTPTQPGKAKNMHVAVDEGKPQVFESRTPAAYTPKELSKFAGTFHSEELNAKYVFTIKENKLNVKVGATETPLEELLIDVFASPQGQIIKFRRDRQNRIAGFTLSSFRVKELIFNKI